MSAAFYIGDGVFCNIDIAKYFCAKYNIFITSVMLAVLSSAIINSASDMFPLSAH